jgi:hypothetical protein
MNFRHLSRLTIVVLMLGAVLSSCDFLVPPPLMNTPAQRVDQFLADLNAIDHTQVYMNLDPGVDRYDDMKVESYWTGWFPLVDGDTPYWYSSLVIGEPDSNEVVTVSANIDGRTSFNGPKYIEMTLVSVAFWDHDPAESLWMIRTITLGFDPIVPYNGGT